MTLGPLFDAAESRSRRDDALSLVEANNGAQVERVIGMIGILCKSKSEFTADDVHRLLAMRGLTEPEQPNVYGAAFRKSAAHLGLIEDTGRAVKSARPEAHSRRIPVWRSLIYRAEVA